MDIYKYGELYGYLERISDDMDFKHRLFKDKEQKYNFNKKIKGYAKKEDCHNITYSLFQFAMIQQKEIEKLTKQLENTPSIETTKYYQNEVDKLTEKQMLINYQKQVEDMPTKYTKPTHMQEFHDVINKMENFLCDLEVEEEDEDLVDELYADIEDVKDKIIKIHGVAVDDWTYWDCNKKKDKIIYSPQSYEEYMVSIDQYIKDNPGIASKRMNNFKKTEILQNKELNQLLKSFKG
tara:strand:+ start:296 stop:1003 length:708 start_codon:yes stop_codon:yes gene_type:complete